MSLLLAGKGGFFGRVTQSAGTVISALIPPMKGLVGRISRFVYNSGATVHTVTILRPIGRTNFTADAAAGQAVINITAEPGISGDTTRNTAGYPQGVTANLLAANDLVAIREKDGVTRLYTVSSRSSLAITLTGNLTAGVLYQGQGSGASKVTCDLWNFGVLADLDPSTGLAHSILAPVASAITTHTDGFGGVACSERADEPILIQSSNGTNQGYIESLSFSYDPPIGA